MQQQHLFFSRPAMHNTLFGVNRNCACVGHMQTMRQTFFHDLGIMCQWPVPQFSSARMHAMNASQDSQNIANGWRRHRAAVQKCDRSAPCNRGRQKLRGGRKIALSGWNGHQIHGWHGRFPMMINLMPPVPRVPRWQRCRRQRRRPTTPPLLLPRQWTQVTSLNEMFSISAPFPCLPKAISRTTSGHGALRMRASSFRSGGDVSCGGSSTQCGIPRPLSAFSVS